MANVADPSAKEKQRRYSAEYRAANAERIKAYQKEWKAKNAQAVAEYQSAYHAEYRDREDVQFSTWMRNLRRNYGITPDDFNRMWAAQAGQCAICQVALAPRGRKNESADVDHDHVTGAVRGLLCRVCNRGIGHFNDRPATLRAAADYLERGRPSDLKGEQP